MTASKPRNASRPDFSDDPNFLRGQGELFDILDRSVADIYAEAAEGSNFLRETAKQRRYNELNHGHTKGISDGADAECYRIIEAARNGIKQVAFTDHGDATGISGQKHQGYYGEEEFHTPEALKMALDEFIEDEHHESLPNQESFEIELAAGMELDFDIENQEQLREYVYDNLVDGPLDMMVLSAHYDTKGRNVGRSGEYKDTEADPEEVLEEYFGEILPAAAEFADEFPRITTLAHWDRPEGNEFLNDHITVEMYEDALNQIQGNDVVLEYNTKTGLRNLLNQGHPTLGSRVLLEKADEFSGGTDTHRIGKSGKVDYNVNETEQRFMELEKVAEQTDKLVPVLDDLDLQTVNLPLNRIFRGRNSFTEQELRDY